MQIQIMWLMGAVAILAIVLALPSASAATLACAVLASLILLPTVVSPSGHKVEVAYWTMVLHPLMAVVSGIGRLRVRRSRAGLRELSRTYGRRARHYAELERQAVRELKEQRESRAFGLALALEREKEGQAFDVRGHPGGGPDADHSWANRVSRASEQAVWDAKEVAFWERKATYYAQMRRKWQRSAFYPWLPVEADPLEPEV